MAKATSSSMAAQTGNRFYGAGATIGLSRFKANLEKFIPQQLGFLLAKFVIEVLPTKHPPVDAVVDSWVQA